MIMRRVVIAALVALAACEKDPTPAPPPLTGDALAGESYSLAALVASHARGATVTWLVEPGGGTITGEGVYTAPACAVLLAALPAGTDLATIGQVTGTDRVTATWDGGSLPITITVREAVLDLSVEPASAEVEVGGQIAFRAHVQYTCHEQVTGSP
jgi:hypothetical protein